MNLIYTVLFGQGDTLKEIPNLDKNWDRIALVDNPHINSETWSCWNVGTLKNTKYASREYKILPRFREDYDTIVYIDATYQVKNKDLNEFVKDKREGVWMTAHPQRQCLYQEAETVKAKSLDSAWRIDNQIARYREDGYPDNNGLYRGGVIIRNKGTERFFENWWNEVLHGSWRDQISAPYAAWKTGTKINPIPHGQVEEYFGARLHSPRNLTNPPVRSETSLEACEATGAQTLTPTLLENRKLVEDYKKVWLQVGQVEGAGEAIEKYPLVHAIFKDKDNFVFQGWLFDYLPYMNEFYNHIKFYNGTYVLWQ